MLADKNEQDQIKAILVQAMANILRKCLNYQRKFNIEGLLGITLDESDVFLVNIKETVHNSNYLISNASKSPKPQPGLALPVRKSVRLTAADKKVIITTGKVDNQAVIRQNLGLSKRAHPGDADKSEPPVKKTRPDPSDPAELAIKEEPLSDDDASGWKEVEDINEETETYTIEPLKKGSQADRARAKKSKTQMVSGSQPVFPDQEAAELGQFLSGMRPIMKDIDDSNDETSNQSGNLRIDTESEDEGGEPSVYIDHCEDGDLNDSMGGERSASTSRPGSGVCMLILDESDGVMCSICNEIFADQTTCRRHMKSAHQAKVAYRCEMCGKRFWHHGDYTEHKEVFHHGPGGYECQQCGKLLLSKRGLKEHMQHHTGQFPYFCFRCVRGFGRKFEFTAHMKKHHPGDPIANHPMNVTQVFAASDSSILDVDSTTSFTEEDLITPGSPSDIISSSITPDHSIEEDSKLSGMESPTSSKDDDMRPASTKDAANNAITSPSTKQAEKKIHTIETFHERQGLKVVIKKEFKKGSGGENKEKEHTSKPIKS